MATPSPKLFVLPKDTTPETRILTLSNPRTSLPCRYLFCPGKGLYEFTKIAAPKAAPKSWLLARPLPKNARGSLEEGERVQPTIDAHAKATEKQGLQDDEEALDVSKGYLMANADLFVATPMDPLFLALPALAPVSTSNKGGDAPKQLFLSMDDHFDKLTSTSMHFASLARIAPFRRRLEQRISAVCDNVEAGDETMYRLSATKLLAELVRKARCMVTGGLPASLEEKFVTRALEVPVMAVPREDSSLTTSGHDEATTARPDSEADQGESRTESTTDSDPSLSRTSSHFSGVSQSTAPTSVSTPDEPSQSPPPPTIMHLLRLRAALTYLCTSYLPAALAHSLDSLLSSSSATTSAVDFTELDAHLLHVARLRQQALLSRSLSSFAHKRSFEDEDDDGETRADKKRRKEEEERKKKAGESRAVRDLKKADVSGMKKLSSFFSAKRVKT
ncbi:MAG: hypothetical protein M1826_004797 [Phylliscum demangeonii]|nr:MAG: hypothetical protein M1826_004797 [Phylliscum demangeonii]